jgi:ABC-type Mn2+/Zn2+ transport system permease subunit
MSHPHTYHRVFTGDTDINTQARLFIPSALLLGAAPALPAPPPPPRSMAALSAICCCCIMRCCIIYIQQRRRVSTDKTSKIGETFSASHAMGVLVLRANKHPQHID